LSLPRILLVKMFRSLLWSSSSGQPCKSTQNTTNCPIVSVEPLNVMTEVSDSLVNGTNLVHKFS